jgi:thiosulfate/3-mercaptopyruvate sulfurtransferase
MHRIWLVLVFVACFGFSYDAQAQVSVTPSWLAEHLQDPSLVVLHVANVRADYTREHIPGARFLWPGWMAQSNPDLSFEVSPVAQLDTLVEGLGITNDSRIVVCHVLGDAAAAARVYITLEYLGLGDRAYILDGGLEAWKAEGRPVTKEISGYNPAKFTPMIKDGVFVDLDYVKARSGKAGVRLVDGRSAQGFDGGGSAVGVFRAGHIPEAVNLPFSAVLDAANRYLPVDSLKTKFESAGIKPGDDIVAYCNSGRTACPVYVAAKMLGYTVHLYDGSFEEWSRQEDLPVDVKEQ